MSSEFLNNFIESKVREWVKSQPLDVVIAFIKDKILPELSPDQRRRVQAMVNRELGLDPWLRELADVELRHLIASVSPSQQARLMEAIRADRNREPIPMGPAAVASTRHFL